MELSKSEDEFILTEGIMNSKFKNIGILFVFILFWIILAERFDIEAVIIGTVISFLILYFNRGDIENVEARGMFTLKKIIYIIEYLFLLIKEIVIANFQVAKIVLSKNIDISPNVIRFKTDLKKDLFKTILANSITLTPGTLTIEVNGDEFIVHCLLEKYKQSLINSRFEDILLKLEGVNKNGK